jgi:hypothetical protein
VSGAVIAACLAAAAPPASAAALTRSAGDAGGGLSGCTRGTATDFPRSGMLEDPARPSVAGWSTTGTWGGNVTGGLCLAAARMYVRDTTDALRTWEVIADGRVITSASFRTGPGYHYWTFQPDVKLGKVRTLCVGVTLPESPGHTAALAARSCYGLGWLA